jgi:hypothetical protein
MTMPVDDLWYLRTRDPDTGERLVSKRHGRGKRWRVRWVDPETGRSRVELFDRKAEAERHDANRKADISRGQYVDPQAGKTTVAEYAEIWRKNQLHRASTADRSEGGIRRHVVPVLGRSSSRKFATRILKVGLRIVLKCSRRVRWP